MEVGQSYAWDNNHPQVLRSWELQTRSLIQELQSNFMTKKTMLKLNLQGSLRKTFIIIYLVDISTIEPEGIIEDVMVYIDSWEHPTNFLR